MQQIDVKIGNIYNYDAYAAMLNVDKSILLLNPIIENFGYTFVAISLEEFQEKFSDLVGLPKKYISETNYRLSDGTSISKEFFELFKTNNFFGFKPLKDLQVFFLKKIERDQITSKEGVYNPGESLAIISRLSEFAKTLILQLRLFKAGDIAAPLIFQIDVDTRNIGVRQNFFRKSYGHADYKITPEDVLVIKSSLKADFKPNQLTHLAIDTFNQCYEIAEAKIRYIMLMVCLESLMNLGKDQIVHTISRHTSLILSENSNEFHKNYKRLKEMYSYRSSIVHGSKIKESEDKLTHELEEYVRKTIIYCLNFKGSKEDLFVHFNAIGFPFSEVDEK